MPGCIGAALWLFDVQKASRGDEPLKKFRPLFVACREVNLPDLSVANIPPAVMDRPHFLSHFLSCCA